MKDALEAWLSGDGPQLARVKPAFQRCRAAGGDECGDEPPLRNLNPVPVQHIAHGGALQSMAAQALECGVTWQARALAQLAEVTPETLSGVPVIQFHKAP